MVDSCRDCSSCKEGCEEYCEVGHTPTYNKDFRPRDRLSTDLGYTLGGYSRKMTVPEDFAIKIPTSFPLEKAGPV